MKREEAIQYIKRRCIGSDDKRDGTEWSDAMWTAIEALKTDIVRCKDCKHNWNTVRNHGVMSPRCDFTRKRLTENDYCSMGERREDGEA